MKPSKTIEIILYIKIEFGLKNSLDKLNTLDLC